MLRATAPVDDPVDPAGAARIDMVEQVTELLCRLAAGELTTRISTLGATGDMRSLADSANALAAGLEEDARTAEQGVRERTAELEQLNSDVMRLSEFGNLLQACEDSSEAFEVIEHEVGLLFPNLAGALYLFNVSRNVLELKASWGGLTLDESLPREHCWALRRGQQHLVLAAQPRLSCRHTLERFGDSICYPMSAQGETLGMLHLMGRSLQLPGTTLLTSGKQRLGIAMAEQTALSLANLRMRDSLGQQALRDSLTGLYNRRFVDECFGREIARAERRECGLGVLMADLDHFKRYNDLHGHEAGDAVLAAVGSAIQNAVREEDIVCRYGGEEILVLLSDVDAESLGARAEHLRSAVSATGVTHRGTLLPPVTVSIGAALFPLHGDRPIDVLRVADAALYDAKQRGRNRVSMAEATAATKT